MLTIFVVRVWCGQRLIDRAHFDIHSHTANDDHINYGLRHSDEWKQSRDADVSAMHVRIQQHIRVHDRGRQQATQVVFLPSSILSYDRIYMTFSSISHHSCRVTLIRDEIRRALLDDRWLMLRV